MNFVCVICGKVGVARGYGQTVCGLACGGVLAASNREKPPSEKRRLGQLRRLRTTHVPDLVERGAHPE